MFFAILSLADLAHLALDVLNNTSTYLLHLFVASFSSFPIPSRLTVRPGQLRTDSIDLTLVPLRLLLDHMLWLFINGLIRINHSGII